MKPLSSTPFANILSTANPTPAISRIRMSEISQKDWSARAFQTLF